MEQHPKQEKKTNFFFAYGSPQFVIGATLVNAFLNTDTKTQKEIGKGLLITLFTILIGLSLIFGGRYLIEFFTPPFVTGYNKEILKIDIGEEASKKLPTSDELKSIVDKCVNDSKVGIKNYKLEEVELRSTWESSPKVYNALVVTIRYSGDNLIEDWGRYENGKYKYEDDRYTSVGEMVNKFDLDNLK